MSQGKSKSTCRNCASGPETFWYMAHKYLFDVDHARRLVADGRESVELDEDDVKFSVETSEINHAHLPHVNTKYPGIIAHIWYQTEAGEMIHGHLLIDGHHRAARCLQLGIPFNVCLLSEEESEAILLKSPVKQDLQLA